LTNPSGTTVLEAPEVVPILIPDGENHLVSLGWFRFSHPLGVGTENNWSTTAHEYLDKTRVCGVAGSEKPKSIRLRVRANASDLDSQADQPAAGYSSRQQDADSKKRI
jgi:hypothetical protein